MRNGHFDVLVVDDEPLVREAMKAVLESYGHQVSIAVDGVDALSVFEDNEFDIVLLDLGLPKMNGYKVAEQMKRMRPEMPVFFITGWGDDVDRAKTKALGVNAVIGKPFQPEDLVLQIEEILLGQQHQRQQ